MYYCGHKKKYGFYMVAAHIQIGKYHLPAGHFIHYPGGFTKQELAYKWLEALRPLLVCFSNVTVLTGSAYAEKDRMDYVIQDCEWIWIGAAKKNRKADGKSVYTRFKYICNSHYELASMYTRSFLSIGFCGYLSHSSYKGLFMLIIP